MNTDKKVILRVLSGAASNEFSIVIFFSRILRIFEA